MKLPHLFGKTTQLNNAVLTNGAKVISTSPHGFLLSDGTQVPGNPEIANQLTAERIYRRRKVIKGMDVNEMCFKLSEEQLELLENLCDAHDIVIIPFPILSTLREMGVRERFSNAVAFNATAETQRLPPDQKIVDINNWSY